MKSTFDVRVAELKPVHDLPEAWPEAVYKQLLHAVEYEDVADIAAEDLPEMAVMALQDVPPAEAATAVLTVLLGERLNAGQRRNLVNDLEGQQMWEEYAQIAYHQDLFLTAVLLNRTFPKLYPHPEIGRLRLGITADNPAAMKRLAAPTADFIIHLLAAGMDEHSILKRLYGEQLAEATFPEAEALIWHSQVSQSTEEGVELVVYSSWSWLRPLKNVAHYQATV